MEVFLFAFGAALIFGFTVHIQHKGIRHLDIQSGIFCNVGSTMVVFWLASPFYISSDYFLTAATLSFALIGLVQPALTMSLSTLGIKNLGPSLSSAIAAVSPIFSLYLAWAILEEDITSPIVIGTLLVIAGVIVASIRRGKVRATWPLWALFLPLGAAFLRAMTQPIAKIGFQEIPSATYATLISSTVSFFVIWLIMKNRKHKIPPLNQGHGWFILAGALNGLGVYLFNSALVRGDVSSVAPVIAIAPVITVLMSQFFFKVESVTVKTWVTVIFVCAGCLLVITA